MSQWKFFSYDVGGICLIWEEMKNDTLFKQCGITFISKIIHTYFLQTADEKLVARSFFYLINAVYFWLHIPWRTRRLQTITSLYFAHWLYCSLKFIVSVVTIKRRFVIDTKQDPRVKLISVVWRGVQVLFRVLLFASVGNEQRQRGRVWLIRRWFVKQCTA